MLRQPFRPRLWSWTIAVACVACSASGGDTGPLPDAGSGGGSIPAVDAGAGGRDGAGSASNDASLPFDGAAGGTATDGASAESGAIDAGRSDGGSADAGTGEGGAPNLWATSDGMVEVFVNGSPIGTSASAGALLGLDAAIVTGENEIVVRAQHGSAAQPFVHLQVSGAFGKAGTSARWKAKAAAGTEATDPTGPWATLAFDDSTWSTATDVNVAPAAPFPTDGPAHGIWTATATDATVLLRLKLYVPAGVDAAQPTGFGRSATGGLGGPTVTVTTTAELTQAVADNTPRIIQIAGTIDYTGSEGTITSSSCFQSQCADGTFEYITNGLGACTSAGKATFDVTYDKAGTDALAVGSNKTLIGIGPNATLRGKGLRMINGVNNVVVRNLTITDINPQIVWGGDAILIDNASDIWIDHVRVSLIGRQFFVTGFGPASNVTLSWNEFDGRTSWSATCNGATYWVMLVLGSSDNITLANNWIHDTSGRAPHAGGVATAANWMQFANDLYETVPGFAANPATGSNLLYEGTAFNRVTTPVMLDPPDAAPGAIEVPLATTVASTNTDCTTLLGRACVANVASPQNGTFPLDTAVLSAFEPRRAGLVAPYPAAEVVNAVPHLAGPGHI